MTDVKLPPLPERDGWAPVLGGENIYTETKMRAYAAEAVRLALEDAALECRIVAQRQQTLGRQFAACDCEAAIRAMKAIRERSATDGKEGET